jgi:hypothetical protein
MHTLAPQLHIGYGLVDLMDNGPFRIYSRLLGPGFYKQWK